MLANARRHLLRRLALGAGIGAVLLVAILICFRRPIAIGWYRCGMHCAQSLIGWVGPRPIQGRFIGRYEYCRDRLVALGYLEHREFALQHVLAATPEYDRLWKLLCENFPDNPHTAMDWYHEPQPIRLDVWDRPARIPEWEAFVAERDVPDLLARVGDAETGGLLQDQRSERERDR